MYFSYRNNNVNNCFLSSKFIYEFFIKVYNICFRLCFGLVDTINTCLRLNIHVVEGDLTLNPYQLNLPYQIQNVKKLFNYIG